MAALRERMFQIISEYLVLPKNLHLLTLAVILLRQRRLSHYQAALRKRCLDASRRGRLGSGLPGLPIPPLLSRRVQALLIGGIIAAYRERNVQVISVDESDFHIMHGINYVIIVPQHHHGGLREREDAPHVLTLLARCPTLDAALIFWGTCRTVHLQIRVGRRVLIGTHRLNGEMLS
jgi:hypothetical protein